MQLTKHHGLANDFLVVLDEVNGRVPAVDGAMARRLCDRRLGIGADGLIHGELPPAGSEVDQVMHLYNADGSRAEMSGNGIRCLGQALAEARDLRQAVFVVSTDAGRRRLQVEESADQRTSLVSVDMGPFAPGPAIPRTAAARLGERRAATGDMGNPHLVVLVDDPGLIDVATEGAWFEACFADGVNVEFISRGRRGHPVPAGVGAGRGHHPGLRDRRLRGRRGGAPVGARGRAGPGGDARRVRRRSSWAPPSRSSAPR